MRPLHGFTARLLAALLLALLLHGGFVALRFHRDAVQREAAALQAVSRELAAHIVQHWPQMAAGSPAEAERAARHAVLAMLMGVNPGVQVYLLDADGRVAEYLGEPGMVRTGYVDLAPLQRFFAGAPLPLHGTDPMGSGAGRLFSAAPFPPRAGDVRPPGYLYVVLDGAPRLRAALELGDGATWRSIAWATASGLLLALLVGGAALRRLTRPLRQLAGRMRAYAQPAGGTPTADAGNEDELRVLDRVFAEMTDRIEAHARHDREQAAAHREAMAAVAHDLRTPLTALHGQLEALAQAPAGAAPRLNVAAALQQSERLRRLLQQLFELATLQSAAQVAQHERFRLDELVADSVDKYRALSAGGAPGPEVRLEGPAPGVVEIDGDLQLVERALANLLENARLHAAQGGPVTVSLAVDGAQACVVVADAGPGLPADVHARLVAGHPLREPPLARRTGGIGGLGLAIAQRVAQLHGGSLQPLPAPRGGTRLRLALPLAG